MHIARSAAADDARPEERSQRAQDLTAWFFNDYRELWSIAFAMLGDAHLAEEVVMESFVKALSSWRRLRRLDYPTSYLKKILLNLCRSKLRRQAIEFRLNALVHRRAEHDGDISKQTRVDLRMDVWNALTKLPPMQRACIVLRYFDDMAVQEIAATLECSPGTVKSHLFRARKSLQRTLDRPTEVSFK